MFIAMNRFRVAKGSEASFEQVWLSRDSHLDKAPEPDGSPLFTLLPLVACWRFEPREHLRPLAIARAAIPPSPLRDRVGYSDHDRFRGYVPVHCRSGLQPPCLRFATAVTGRHARLGSRLLARLCRGRHRRRQTSTRLQGATLIEPDRQICRVARPLLAFAPTEPTVRRYRSGLFRKDLRRVDHCRHAWWITGSGRGKAIRSWR